MRSEKGFTLLELLGVMIVLAVISLIAVPIVMDSVNESRKSTLRNSYQSLLKAIDMNKSYDTINFSKMYVVREGVLNPDVDYEGELEGDGTIVVNSKGQIKVLVQTEDWCISKEYEDSKVSIQDGECSTSADLTYPEYAYVPEIQQALIDGTRKLETDVTLALDETTSGIIYNGTSQDLILPSSIAGTPLWEYSFVSKPDGTPLPLATIYMPDGIQKINTYAFKDETQLNFITFPPSVVILDNWVFEGATALQTITFTSTEVPTIIEGSNGTFKNLKSDVTIRVPQEALANYKAAWTTSLGSGNQIIGY